MQKGRMVRRHRLNTAYIAIVKSITWTHEARSQLRNLPLAVRSDIEAKVARFAKSGAGNVKRLVGRPGARLRVGDWRVIFVETAVTVEVRAVGHRRDIYR
jgi:mRNA interferase RelE/StbE